MSVPVKGTVWTHATRKDYKGVPIEYTVTSVREHPRYGRVIYSRERYGHKLITPVRLWETGQIGQIKSVPTPAPKAPRLSESECRDLFYKAHTAGHSAALAATPAPMRVQGYSQTFTEGMCGFAWVKIRPANGAFARWLKDQAYARKAYDGGVDIWVSEYGQSHDRKAAYAHAFAAVVRAAGIDAHAGSRLD